MTLVQYLNSQFALTQYLDFLGRLLLACLCGAAIGYERTKRFNEAGIRSNVAQLERLLSERARKGDSTPRLRIVMGFVADKDLDHILPLFPGDATYYLTQAQIPRALNYRELHKRVTELGYSATEWPTVREAYEAALANSAPDDILFIGGSTFIVADFLESCNS